MKESSWGGKRQQNDFRKERKALSCAFWTECKEAASPGLAWTWRPSHSLAGVRGGGQRHAAPPRACRGTLPTAAARAVAREKLDPSGSAGGVDGSFQREGLRSGEPTVHVAECPAEGPMALTLCQSGRRPMERETLCQILPRSLQRSALKCWVAEELNGYSSWKLLRRGAHRCILRPHSTPLPAAHTQN